MKIICLLYVEKRCLRDDDEKRQKIANQAPRFGRPRRRRPNVFWTCRNTDLSWLIVEPT